LFFPVSDISALLNRGDLIMVKGIYLLICLLGFLLPYSQFLPFVLEHGLDIKLFFEQLFANKISGFFGMDVIVSSLALWTFVFWEGTRLKMQNLWVYVVCNLLFGVSLGLPLFLFMRQRQLEKQADILGY
jgi:Terpene cyclase DEP1